MGYIAARGRIELKWVGRKTSRVRVKRKTSRIKTE